VYLRVLIKGVAWIAHIEGIRRSNTNSFHVKLGISKGFVVLLEQSVIV